MKITNQGINILNNELATLETRKTELSFVVSKAREYGDLRENAEYTSAVSEIQRIEERITFMRTTMLNAEIISAPINPNIIELGAKVSLLNMSANKQIEYIIVGELESDFSKGLISNTSLFGQSIIGLKLNSEFQFKNILYKIEKIQY